MSALQDERKKMNELLALTSEQDYQREVSGARVTHRSGKLSTLKTCNGLLHYSWSDERKEKHVRQMRRRTGNGNTENGRIMGLIVPRATWPKNNRTIAQSSFDVKPYLEKAGSVLHGFDPDKFRQPKTVTEGSTYLAKCRTLRNIVHPEREKKCRSLTPSTNSRRCARFPATTARVLSSQKPLSERYPLQTPTSSAALISILGAPQQQQGGAGFGEIAVDVQSLASTSEAAQMMGQRLAAERRHRPLMPLPFFECAPPAPIGFRSGAL